jgi:hypothetical protein
VRPRRGDALLFHNVHLNGHEDPTSLHGGCAVLGGTKWTATKWMRAVSLFLVIFGYFWLFLVIFGYVRTGNWTDVDVVFCLQGPYEAEREIKRRAEIAEYWEEKARRGEGIGEESRGKLNERGNLETYQD